MELKALKVNSVLTTSRLQASVDWLNKKKWVEFCELVDWYRAKDEGIKETWPDAEKQWRRVADQAEGLLAGLSGLGELACIIQVDAAVQAPGEADLSEDLRPFRPGDNLFYLQELEALVTFARAAETKSREMARATNGAHKEDNRDGKLRSLWWRLQGLMRGRAKGHQEAVLGVVHELVTEKKLGSKWTERGGKGIPPKG